MIHTRESILAIVKRSQKRQEPKCGVRAGNGKSGHEAPQTQSPPRNAQASGGESLPSLTRVRGGRKAKASGERFENVINMALGMPSCLILAVNLPSCGAKFVGKGRIVSLPIPCDYAGCVRGSGRAVFFDAKRSEDAYSFDLSNPKLLKPHQRAFLEAMDAAGAIAGLLIECVTSRKYLWISAKDFRGLKVWRWDSSPINLGDTDHLPDFGKLVAAFE